MTPIQLANMIATVANRGFYYTPHIIKKIKDGQIDKKYTTKHVTTIERKYYEPMINGLFDVYNLGTAQGLNVEGIDICGKTGTAENYTKINGNKLPMHQNKLLI
jgi:penicillin-binding protein 2